MTVRRAEPDEIALLARIWFDAWHESHARIVPAALTRLRTIDNFRDRLRAALPDTRVAGPPGSPVGFCIIKGDELHQLFVSKEARGTGVAGALMADGEARLLANGIKTAWLACAIGNHRAARFYEKTGWRRIGTMVNQTETAEGPFPLVAWRYEKILSPELEV